MEKKVYLLTLTCFSKLEKGVEYQITLCFDCDAEIAVFVSVPPEEDATPFHPESICFRLCVFAGAEVEKVCHRCLELDAKLNYEKLHYAEYL